MSTTTWLQEFYPISAKKLADDPNSTDRDLVIHSLKKWTGLSPENLKIHNMFLNETVLKSPGGKTVIRVNYRSCALCLRHIDRKSKTGMCATCPIVRAHGFPCDDYTLGAYHESLFFGSPKMIDLLRETLTYLETEK